MDCLGLRLRDSGDTQIQDSIMAVGVKITIILFVCVRMCVCVCGYVFSFSGSFVWLMYYDTMMNNVWQKSLKIPFKHETAPARLWILNVSSVSCYFAVLWRTGLHHKNSKSCSFPSTLVGICDFFLQDGRDGCPAS